jgi:ABC-type uncharacterized transport system ATPase component
MLEVHEVKKTFNRGTPDQVCALQGINLTIDAGSFVVVIGTNGSGKSTLLNAVAGTFQVDSGTISVGGVNITRWSEHQRAKLIGRVFQNPFSGTAANMHTAALDPKSAEQVIALTDGIVKRERLTTLMVTHSMYQAADLGDRLIMMHSGRIVQDFRGAEKKRIRVDDLLIRFEEIRRADQLDESAAEMLRCNYV